MREKASPHHWLKLIRLNAGASSENPQPLKQELYKPASHLLVMCTQSTPAHTVIKLPNLPRLLVLPDAKPVRVSQTGRFFNRIIKGVKNPGKGIGSGCINPAKRSSESDIEYDVTIQNPLTKSLLRSFPFAHVTFSPSSPLPL